jgi:hypothetical protein
MISQHLIINHFYENANIVELKTKVSGWLDIFPILLYSYREYHALKWGTLG